jgi:hypothetical protein
VPTLVAAAAEATMPPLIARCCCCCCACCRLFGVRSLSTVVARVSGVAKRVEVRTCDLKLSPLPLHISSDHESECRESSRSLGVLLVSQRPTTTTAVAAF